MNRLSSPLKSSEETFDVVLSGGSPWGFTLQGGSEFRTKLSVSKITPGGKAELSQSIAVGDEVVAINGIDCISRAEAIELVRCSRQKLKIKLRREGGSGSGPARQPNGKAVKKSNDIIPNLYKTASEHFSNSDFYSTYNVDRQTFAQITQNNRAKNIYDSTDNLSASLDDLLESYRQSEKQPNITSSAIMEETKPRLSNSSSEIANGRTSPRPEVDGLSGASLPEGSWPVFHQRTYTSPGRIQKVTVKSTNISLSPQKESPPGRENQNQQTARNSVNRDDWFGRWLLDKPQQVTPINAGNIPYKDKNKNKEKEKEIPDRRISMHERTEYERTDVKKSQSLPRSKSFGGPTSYGVTVTATAVKRNEGGSSNTLPPSRSPQRYSSSNLIQEKPVRAGNTSDSRPDEPFSRPIEMSRNSQVYASPGDTVEVRLPRDIKGTKMTTSESTSSLDSVGTMDSAMGGTRKQGPAPPPRRSVSKLLSSFRTPGRRQVPESVHIPPKFGAVSRLSEGASNQPIHSASRSWPTEHVVDSKTTGSEKVRQSWHAEPAVMTGYSRIGSEANTSTSSDVTPERKISKTPSIRCKSSVVIRSMRSSSSSSVDDNAGPTVYRSGQITPEAEHAQSSYRLPKKKLSEGNPPVKLLSDAGGWMSQNRRHTESETSRIEDTQILQRLILDKANSADSGTSVKSRIATFEGGSKPSREILSLQHRSSSQGRIDVLAQPLKSSPVSQSSSMDSLLGTRSSTKLNEKLTDKDESRPETRSPAKFNETSTEKRGSLAENPPRTFNESSTKKRGSLPESRSPTRFSTASTDSRGSVGESRSPTRFNTDRYETPPHIDKASAKQWEANGNFIPSRRNENSQRPSSNTFTAKDSTDERDQRADNLFSPTRVERQQASEEPLRKFDASVDRAAPLNDKFLTSNISQSDFKLKAVEQELPPLSSNDDGEVFWNADDSFPPPPPLNLVDPLETSQDNLPLPPPPREVLVEFPAPYIDYNSRSDPIQTEPSIVSSDIGKQEEVLVESSVEIVEQPKVELNGPGKIDISDVSDPALETTSSTDLSFPDTSATANNKGTQRAPPPAPLLITSTPTRDDPIEMDTHLDNSTSPYSLGSSTSTPLGSRPNSMLSPKLEALDKEKSDLVDSMKQKIIDLRSQMDEIKDEIDGNEQLGEKVTKVVESKASPAEFSKYQLFTGELNKIIGLLLILTQRMHRYEMMLNDLDMSEEADRQQKDILLSKIDKVTLQHEEACKIKEVNDKRGEVVSKILENCLEEEEFADFQYYIDMKTQLALMHAEIRDKVKMGEERLNTLTSTKIDWSIFSLT